MLRGISYWCAGLLFLQAAHADFDLGYGTDDDLYHFVTRPDLRAPRFNVKKYFPDEITPGYWFIAPYAQIVQESFPKNYVQPCQTGPAIYDGDGELIWSGACLVKNQNTCDFRVFEANGSAYLSAILNSNRQFDAPGQAIVMDNSFQIIQRHRPHPTMQPFNMHEFLVLNDGTKALMLTQRPELTELVGLRGVEMAAGLVLNMAAREFDLNSGEVDFEWWTYPEVPLNYSNAAPTNLLKGPFPSAWDFLHLNAVDKSDKGDYLVTARYTDAIYKVSGTDKKLLWSLGGHGSDFVLDGFAVSGAHDARFSSENGEKEYITFLDNGGDEQRKLADTSTAYLLELDKSQSPWVARVVQKWARPDGLRSDKRGNFQTLPNGNAFVGWSEDSYMSEHTPDGRLLLEARFESSRFVSYRSYKFNFTGDPVELPIVKAFAYGESPETSVSVYYVSWNGATDVAEYRFYDGDTEALIGAKQRQGFETVFMHSGYTDFIYVEAIMRSGSVGGLSDLAAVQMPSEWGERALPPVSPETWTKTEL